MCSMLTFHAETFRIRFLFPQRCGIKFFMIRSGWPRSFKSYKSILSQSFRWSQSVTLNVSTSHRRVTQVQLPHKSSFLLEVTVVVTPTHSSHSFKLTQISTDLDFTFSSQSQLVTLTCKQFQEFFMIYCPSHPSSSDSFKVHSDLNGWCHHFSLFWLKLVIMIDSDL
jgi:hypothetical protein